MFSITKEWEPLDKSLYVWDSHNNMLVTTERWLVLDFTGYDWVIFYTGDSNVFYAGNDCSFKTGGNCIFNVGDGCHFDTESGCVFNTGEKCKRAVRQQLNISTKRNKRYSKIIIDEHRFFIDIEKVKT